MMSILAKEPVYHQLTNHLRRLIGSQEYPVGSKFLTERRICDRFGVSRATANKVLSGLVSEGLLDFRKGVGTFVRIRTLDYNLQALVSFTEEAQAAGKRPATQVLRLETVKAQDVLDEVPALLQAAPDSLLYYLERLRLAGGMPVIYERRHVVAEYCPGLTEEDLAGSLYALWAGRYGLTIEGAEERVQASATARPGCESVPSATSRGADRCGLRARCTAETPTSFAIGSAAFSRPAMPGACFCIRGKALPVRRPSAGGERRSATGSWRKNSERT
jgi:GntR family transcriptional regulator